MSIHNFIVKSIDGSDHELKQYQGKVVLVVNTASKCGFTPQYEGLEELYKNYKDKGLEIIAFPCNQFGAQEPGEEEDIKSFCKTTYDVSFPLMSKVDVNGENASEVYEYLKTAQTGLLGSKAIKWNFTKFLIDQDGNAIKRYAPQTKPQDIASDIEKLLK